MKKNSKTALMAAILTGAVMLTGCDHGKDDVQDVYGPPNVTEATEATDEPVQVEYGAPVTEAVTTAKPVTVPAVYGPPPTDEFTTDPVTQPDTTEYDPSGGIQVVYGPPEMFEN